MKRSKLFSLQLMSAAMCLAAGVCESTQAAETNLALNLAGTGYPSPLESDRGWGGGSWPWQMVDGLTVYPDWYGGLAFTGGNNNWGGEPCGPRQATIDLGARKTFHKVVLWHHGDDNIPTHPSLTCWDGAAWQPISFSRDYSQGTNGWSRPDTYTFAPVTGSKVRWSYNNCLTNVLGSRITHGWIYEFEVYGNTDPAPLPAWQEVAIPGLPAGSDLTSVWSRNPGEVYVWGRVVTNSINHFTLYRRSGTNWSNVLSASGPEWMGSVFGVGATDVFAAAQTNIWRSTDNGLTWSRQVLPVTGRYMFRKISGTPSNIHAAGFYSYSGDAGWILRFDGSSWQKVYSGTVQGLDVISPTEGYFVACLGWGRWDGASWSYVPQGWDFCDVGPMAAIREPGGAFHWWVAGNNNWANGVRVWCFNTNTGSFGSKHGYCFADGDGYLVGGAYGLWGASATDVYVVGGLAAANQGQQSARAYHYNGTGWSRINGIDGAGALYDVCGTSGNNVWMCGANGRLLHYGEVAGLSPHVACPPAAVLECGVPAQLIAQVSDPEGDAMAVVWVLNGTAIQTNSVPAAPPGTVFDVPLAGSFPLGTNILTIGVTDGANTASCTTSVTVVDTTPPVIGQVVASPSVLWPPNQKMVPVTVQASVSDSCSPAAWRIVRVRSNEPVNGHGYGNTFPDWIITGDHTLKLRAERSGKGSGRVYYVTVQATDAAGNQSQPQTVTVTVPKRKGTAKP